MAFSSTSQRRTNQIWIKQDKTEYLTREYCRFPTNGWQTVTNTYILSSFFFSPCLSSHENIELSCGSCVVLCVLEITSPTGSFKQLSVFCFLIHPHEMRRIGNIITPLYILKGLLTRNSDVIHFNLSKRCPIVSSLIYVRVYSHVKKISTRHGIFCILFG